MLNAYFINIRYAYDYKNYFIYYVNALEEFDII